MTSAPRRVVLIRHGQTEWSASGRHTGRTDIDLTEVGERQAAALVDTVTALRLDHPHVIASPRRRAQRTAHLAGLRVDDTTELVGEWDYGDYEGLTSVEIHARFDPAWTIWNGGGPHAESVATMTTRVDEAIAYALTSSDRDIVIVSHGHFSRSFVARFLGQDIAFGAHVALEPAGVAILAEAVPERQLLGLGH
jgi:broad specificity phosphatase PhoE